MRVADSDELSKLTSLLQQQEVQQQIPPALKPYFPKPEDSTFARPMLCDDLCLSVQARVRAELIQIGASDDDEVTPHPLP